MLQLIKNTFNKRQTTNEVIEQIHNEFNNAGEQALKQANDIIAGIDVSTQQKVESLKKLGFTGTKEVTILDGIIAKEDEQKKIAKALTELTQKYPGYKFITQQMASDIATKYNLVIGDVSQYKGFVPSKNIRDIENFYKVENNLSIAYYRRNIHFGSFSEISEESYEKETKRRNNTNSHHSYWSHVEYSRKPRILKIAAPLKDMSSEGYTLKNRIFIKREIPDPVVLASINYNGVELYCIVTAWGDEASDEIIVNQKMN